MANKININNINNYHKFQTCTFNMHGINQGATMLNYLCTSVNPSVIFIQEHWQAPDNMHKILSFSPDYIGFGISAIESKVSSGILYGRPYGGVAILVHNSYAKVVKNVLCTKRYVILMIGSLACVNVYFPTKSNVIKSEQLLDSVNNIIDEVTSHLSALAPEYILFGGDLNTNLHIKSAVSDAIFSMADELKIIDCSTIAAPNLDYSYHVVSTGHTSWIDWLLVSSELAHLVVAVDMLDDGANLSDHLPVSLEMNLKINIDGCEPLQSKSQHTSPKLRWDKANLNAYYDMSRSLLQPILDEFRPLYVKIVNDVAFSHANSICASGNSKTVSDYGICRKIAVYLIDKFYPLVTSALCDAARCTVPLIKSNFLKHWWSGELQQVKNKSAESHRLWVEAGKPRSGLIFDLFKKDNFAYKLAVRDAKCRSDLSITNDLHDALCSKDPHSFWKIWHSKFDPKNVNKSSVIEGLADQKMIADKFADYFYDVCKPNSDDANESFRQKFNDVFLNYLGNNLSRDNFFLLNWFAR